MVLNLQHSLELPRWLVKVQIAGSGLQSFWFRRSGGGARKSGVSPVPRWCLCRWGNHSWRPRVVQGLPTVSCRPLRVLLSQYSLLAIIPSVHWALFVDWKNYSLAKCTWGIKKAFPNSNTLLQFSFISRYIRLHNLLETLIYLHLPTVFWPYSILPYMWPWTSFECLQRIFFALFVMCWYYQAWLFPRALEDYMT